MADFMFYQPTRIDFGAGKLEKAGEIVASYGNSCLLVTTTNKEDVLRPLYDRVKKILEKAGIRSYLVQQLRQHAVQPGNLLFLLHQSVQRTD